MKLSTVPALITALTVPALRSVSLQEVLQRGFSTVCRQARQILGEGMATAARQVMGTEEHNTHGIEVAKSLRWEA